MQKFILLSGTALGAISVMIGAFGAHALRANLETTGRLDTFETAVKYQFYHTLAILFIGLLLFKIESGAIEYAAISMLAGIFVFSGSLYILCLTNVGSWGAVTPFGGLLLIMGWVLLFIGLYKQL